ncbi:MAG: hypothetical protein WD177_07385, partial [Methylophaga sp.]
MNLKRISVTVGAALAINSAQVAYAAPATISVSVGGSQYELTTINNTSYSESKTLLQSQPWWGNETLALNLAAAIQMDLGDYFGILPPVFSRSA